MKLRTLMRTALMGAALLATPAAFAQQTASANPNAPDQTHPGKAVYDKACAMCHANPAAGDRAATFATLTGTTQARLREVLSEGGIMAPMAAALKPDEVTQLIGYLTSGQKATAASWTDAMMCAADKRAVNVSAPASFPSFTGDLKGSRNFTAKQSGLKKADMANLEIAWSVGFPNTQALGTGYAILGDTVFVNAGGKTLALDAASGCAKWVQTISSRNTPTIGVIDGKTVLAFTSGRNEVNVLDAATGQLIWKASGQPERGAGGAVRGAVVIYKDKIIVPISASGVATGMNAKFECCDGHGAVVALSAKDGKRLWEYHTMEEAQYTGEVSPAGVKQRGPSGAPIWSVPIIDEKRNRVIVTTGENTSHPGTDTSDAVIALDLNTGKVAWQFQAMSLDVWNMSCAASKETSGPNCPYHSKVDTGVGRDFDFGAQAILAKGKGGKDVVLAGQKSGHVWALDAETGKKLWSQQVGKGTALGGVHWGITADAKTIYAPISDPFDNGAPKPGMFAFDIATGKPVWSYDAKPDCTDARKKNLVNCESKYGFSVAPLVVDGAVVAGTLDSRLFVFDAKTGKIIKTMDFAGPLKTTWGVDGKGGSIDSHAISVGAGAVFVGAGYGSFSQTPGNVLIALKPKGK